MKSRLLLLCVLAVAALLWTGCATQPVETSAEISSAEQKETAESAKKPVEEKEKEPEMKVVMEEIQLLSKRLSYFFDGVLDDYREYIYAEEGTALLEERLYNSENEVQEKKVYTYEGDLLVSMEIYDEKGEIRSIHTYSYNNEGLLKEDALYNGKEELQTRQEYEYGPGGEKTKWSVFGSSGALLSYSEYLYENGLNTRIENYNPAGELLDYFLIEYDDQDRPVKNTWFTGNNSVEESREFLYGSGALIEEIVRRGNGSVKRRIRYTNNDFGNPVEAVYTDAGGKVLETIACEYSTRSVEKLVEVK